MNLLDADARSLLRPDNAFGPLLKGFVGMEIDVVLEDRRGKVVAIEVTAATTVRSDDLRGLRHLADRLSPDLVAGIVLHTGTTTLPFGDRMQAMPISSLWEL